MKSVTRREASKWIVFAPLGLAGCGTTDPDKIGVVRGGARNETRWTMKVGPDGTIAVTELVAIGNRIRRNRKLAPAEKKALAPQVQKRVRSYVTASTRTLAAYRAEAPKLYRGEIKTVVAKARVSDRKFSRALAAADRRVGAPKPAEEAGAEAVTQKKVAELSEQTVIQIKRTEENLDDRLYGVPVQDKTDNNTIKIAVMRPSQEVADHLYEMDRETEAAMKRPAAIVKAVDDTGAEVAILTGPPIPVGGG